MWFVADDDDSVNVTITNGQKNFRVASAAAQELCDLLNVFIPEPQKAKK